MRYYYCQSFVAYLTTAVVKQELIISTAVSEYFPAQIAAAGAGFAGYYCHQAMKKG